MKVKKLLESKKLVEDDQIDPIDDSTSEIKAEVKDAADGEISDEVAADIAQQTKDVGTDVNAGYAVFNLTDEDWSDVTITNAMYKTLDMAYKNAKTNMRSGIKAGANVLINGLPGSGKTAIVENWAHMHKLQLVALNATDSKSDAAINGMPVRDQDKPDELIYLFNNKKLNKLLDPNYKEQCVIFVDELNRQQTAALRRPLMSLFNEKRNADGSKDFSKNLLFSIVCINPADGSGGQFHDKGLADIFGAEDDRFPFQIEEFDSNIKDALAFYRWYRQNELLNLGIIMPNTAASKNHGGYVGPSKRLSKEELLKIKRILKVCELAEYILTHVTDSKETEIFSQRADIDKEFREGKKRPVTARGLFDGLMIGTDEDTPDKSNVKDFLDYVDVASKWSSAKKKMFHDILNTYVMDVKGLFDEYNLDKDPDEIMKALNNPKAAQAQKPTQQQANAADDEQEDDDGLFSSDELNDVSSANAGGTDVDIDAIMSQWK